jgi:hypothetical protein
MMVVRRGQVVRVGVSMAKKLTGCFPISFVAVIHLLAMHVER